MMYLLLQTVHIKGPKNGKCTIRPKFSIYKYANLNVMVDRFEYV